MRNVAAALAVLGSACSAWAQIGLGTLTWEVNDGSGWTSGHLVTSEPAVMVRLVAAWTSNAGYAFSGTQFDALVTSDSTDADLASQFERVFPFNRGLTQTLIATRFGNTLKIDDARDSSPPGQGPRGIFPGQLVEGFGDPFTTANPVAIFQFRLTFDDAPGPRVVSSRHVAPSGGNTVDRVMRLYTTSTGASNLPSTTSFPLEIVYVPGPGASTLTLVAAGGLARRRRRS
jgi:hypothetical protein